MKNIIKKAVNLEGWKGNIIEYLLGFLLVGCSTLFIWGLIFLDIKVKVILIGLIFIGALFFLVTAVGSIIKDILKAYYE